MGEMPIDRDATDGDRPGGCWRNHLDTNLKRFHALLFSIDRAIEKSDFTLAHIIGVRLLGFLESRIETPVDAAFIAPIHAEVSSKIASCLRILAPESDRRAFEQAKREESNVFVKRGGFDVEKVKKSQLFQRFIGMSSASSSTASAMVDSKSPEMLNAQSKLAVQAKIVSAPDDVMSKRNNLPNQNLMGSGGRDHEECTIVAENRGVASHNYLKSNSVNITLHGDNDGGTQVNSNKHKRRNIGFTSPVCGNVKASPKSVDGCGSEVAKGFVTAKKKLEMDMKQKHGCMEPPSATVSPKNKSPVSIKNYGARSGGLHRRGLRGNFVPPIRSNGGSTGNVTNSRNSGRGDDLLEDSTRRCMEMLCGSDGELPEKLRNLEPRLIEHVSNEIMDKDPNVRWDDIAGLEHAKKCVTEMVVWPLLRPDLFRGCRAPGRGLLLFGPPGTGKTMIGKAIAGESKATFFYISASSLTSKWIGEGEKLVRALFGVASCRQPAVIFVDEIDSLLSQRKSDGEHESSRRLKTQLLIEMEGFDNGNEQILLIGATNRPQELDEAARRRLTKRLYIPLPSSDARAWIIQNLLEKDGLFKLGKEDIASICKLTEGYSGSDMKNLVKDASMGPLREAMRKGSEITKLRKEDMRIVNVQDFKDALQEVRPSVSTNELDTYQDWNKQFGSLSM